jgi:superfamily II RNA helicase
VSPAARPLAARLPDPSQRDDPDALLGSFLDWTAETGLELYPEQEEAILELLAGRHVVLSTPTGSGKSLVALALHWKALWEGRRSFYTAPVKALVSEKFFSLCAELGAERVGMLTGDASVNRDAPVVCCTAEVLANMALRQGAALDAPYAVLDEFHYYADRDRGAAWQIPLIALPRTRFLLMSATLGNTAAIEERLRERTGREVAHVHSDVRPVPLDFEYRETTLLETLEDLHARELAPIYVVSFTQRECAERAQGLTSARLSTREERQAIARAIAGVRFDTAYGRELRRILGFGLGVHHAGLLPRYRLLVEQLAQRGLLKVILGTDTLGVGVNIPIRTAVFTRLTKYDGEKVAVLSVRDFKQIAGRAGRKGFDVRGAVVCQAPEHVVENRRLEAKSRARGGRRPARKQPPPGFVPWNEATFRGLIERPPESLESRFDLSHGTLVAVLQRQGEDAGGYRSLIRLIEHSHESAAAKARLRRRCAALFRSLRGAGILEIVDADLGPPEVRIRPDLQPDFSLHRTLSLYLVEALEALDPEAPDFALVVLSLVESIQEDPRPILREQRSRARRELVARLKAEGVDYEDRRRRAEEVSWPRPEADFIGETFRLFARAHPWVGDEDVRPKSIAREMFEGLLGFREYVKEYSLARSEGVLLRYLSQVHNTLAKSVPERWRSDEVYDALAFLRATLSRVDSSLVEAWQDLAGPAPAEEAQPAPPPFDLARHERALRARVRQDMHALVAALARRDFAEAATRLRDETPPEALAERLQAEMAAFFADYGELVTTPEARRAQHTRVVRSEPRRFQVTHVLLDPAGDHTWAVYGEVDLRSSRDPEGPLVELIRIGT